MNASMLRHLTLAGHKLEGQFARRLQNRNLSIGVGNDDVDFRHIEQLAALPPLGHQDVTGNAAHLLDCTNAANEKLRHSGRVDNTTHFDDPCARRGFSFRSPAEGQIRTECGAPSSDISSGHTVSFSNGQEGVNGGLREVAR